MTAKDHQWEGPCGCAECRPYPKGAEAIVGEAASRINHDPDEWGECEECGNAPATTNIARGSEELNGCAQCAGLPPERDDDIPIEWRRELMADAVEDGRISYYYLVDIVRRARADIEAERVSSQVVGWQAIETAPTDGYVWLYYGQLTEVTPDRRISLQHASSLATAILKPTLWQPAGSPPAPPMLESPCG